MEKVYNNLQIFDGSYILHRSLSQPELWDFRNDLGYRTGGVYGSLKILNAEINEAYYPVVCWDAGLSKRRLYIYPQYKHNNEREEEYAKGLKIVNEEVEYQDDDFQYQYHTQREALIQIIDALGIPNIKIKGQEGDDLQVLCSRLAKKSIIVSDDKDLLQLLDDNVCIQRSMKKEFWTKDDYCFRNNITNLREIIIRKAIIGDASDNIDSTTKGLDRSKCCGEKGAEEIAKVIANNYEDESKYIPILEQMSEDKTNKNRNKIKGFLERLDHYKRNMKLVDLSLVENDENVVKIIDIIENRNNNKDINKVNEMLYSLNIKSFDTSKIQTIQNNTLTLKSNIKELF